MIHSDGRPLLDLKADCANCFGLCCVALPFGRSADFAFDKSAGEPCRNLQDDFSCGIHSKLRDSGFKGCTVYDCFGAGQKVAQASYHGVSWREAPDTAGEMFEVFGIMRQLHELLWYLVEARALDQDPRLIEAIEGTMALTELPAGELLAADVAAHLETVSQRLFAVSERVRTDARAGAEPLPATAKPGADLAGAQLAGHDLRGADLRGTCLIAADLSGSDLREADVIGADFRDTQLGGADLSGVLFLTQFQVNAARGDASTKLPDALDRPSHWR